MELHGAELHGAPWSGAHYIIIPVAAQSAAKPNLHYLFVFFRYLDTILTAGALLKAHHTNFSRNSRSRQVPELQELVTYENQQTNRNIEKIKTSNNRNN